MKTVKAVSKLTGISVRTLHYYDEIGLLKPSGFNEAGYRLYDDKALEMLQQILFFREFHIPLKEIKAILGRPDFDKNEVLRKQKKMLELKKARLERLIESISGILEGDCRMDFEVFSKGEIEELYASMVNHMPEQIKESIIEEYGGMEEFHKNYMSKASGRKAQENYKKLTEWYGDKEKAVKAAKNPTDAQMLKACQKRLDDTAKKLSLKIGGDVNCFEIKEIIGEYGFVIKQIYQLDDETKLMLDLAASYEIGGILNETADRDYGKGFGSFFAEAVRAFYHQ